MTEQCDRRPDLERLIIKVIKREPHAVFVPVRTEYLPSVRDGIYQLLGCVTIAVAVPHNAQHLLLRIKPLDLIYIIFAVTQENKKVSIGIFAQYPVRCPKAAVCIGKSNNAKAAFITQPFSPPHI